MREARDAFDYVIVGGGSAGCVLANRLSADPATRVLLLEAGPRDRSLLIHMPAGIARLVDHPVFDWRYYTEPEPALDGRRLYWPRGRVLGGSSSINAMCYTRGQPEDYDEWAARGNPGWDFASVLPFFRRAERSYRGEGPYHGASGPLTVSASRQRHPLSAAFVAAALERGHRASEDFNGARQEGVGFYDVTQQGGRRCSAAVAYLRPVRARPNLVVRTMHRAARVIFSGPRATGVEYLHRGRRRSVLASREVLVCAGTIGSPQLLMLSGVGDARQSRALGIPVVANLPGVGANLQDHLDVCSLWKSRRSDTYDFGRLDEAGVALRWLLTRAGPGASNVAESGGFLRSPLAQDARPDLQFHFVPAQLDDHGRHRLPGHGFTVHACALRPRSRGSIRLASADPAVAPRIAPRYLSEPEDLDLLVEAVHLARDIVGARPFDDWRGEELFPGPGHDSRRALIEFIRRKAESIYHPVGTCRMGPAREPGTVVDASLRVHGLEGLRVVDASVMPQLVSGNTNAPTIMIAERAAELLLREDTRAAVAAPLAQGA
jgi:choline dehydrogenase